MRRTIARLLALLALLPLPLGAQQQDTARPAGISLITRYDPAVRPALAVRAFGGAPALREALDSMTAIVARDLENSDRFNVRQPPASLQTAGAVRYPEWNALPVTWLVTGDAVATAAGYELQLAVHDVVYARLKQRLRLRLPATSSPEFRLAVHAVSDEVVRIITGQAGIAATRVAFTRANPKGSHATITYDLLMVDSDGHSQRRLSGTAGLIYSPAWSPDGRKLLYTQNNGGWRLIERDMASGSARTIDLGPANAVMTPRYAPDGRKIALALWRNTDTDLYEYDIAQGCCLRRLAESRADEQSPTYSRDGSRIAYLSNRYGNPHIFMMPASGGNGVALSPFVRGQRGFYTSPDWSPTSSAIAFHGHWNNRGGEQDNYQIFLADAERPGAPIRQLTSEGSNADPSWAPDGRHLVYTHKGVRGTAPGLYVVDTETGTRRALTVGSAGYRLADWSPVLLRAEAIVMAGQ